MSRPRLRVQSLLGRPKPIADDAALVGAAPAPLEARAISRAG
jgi:hypothetical protein